MAKSKAPKAAKKTSESGWDMKFKVYQDNDSEFRWRLVASNGRIMAVSSEGYVTQANAERAILAISKELRKDNPATLHEVLEPAAPPVVEPVPPPA